MVDTNIYTQSTLLYHLNLSGRAYMHHNGDDKCPFSLPSVFLFAFQLLYVSVKQLENEFGSASVSFRSQVTSPPPNLEHMTAGEIISKCQHMHEDEASFGL